MTTKACELCLIIQSDCNGKDLTCPECVAKLRADLTAKDLQNDEYRKLIQKLCWAAETVDCKLKDCTACQMPPEKGTQTEKPKCDCPPVFGECLSAETCDYHKPKTEKRKCVCACGGGAIGFCGCPCHVG